MARWGWRQIAAFFVAVLVTNACEPASLSPPATLPEVLPQTLIVRTPRSTSDAPQTVTAAASPSAATAPARTAPPVNLTPTPRYHAVQPGDTLQMLAERYGVTVAALQAANPGLVDALLLPGQMIRIPPPAALATAPAPSGTFFLLLPTNTPRYLDLPPPDCYLTPANEAICLGWVPNPGEAPLANVVVRVALRDDSGALRGEVAVPVLQSLVLPEAGAPYAARFAEPPEFAYAEANALSAEDGSQMGAAVVVLQVQARIDEIIEGVVYVRGQAVSADAAVEALLVVAALRDDAGRVVAYRVVHPEGGLAAGEPLLLDVALIPFGEAREAEPALWIHVEGRAQE